MNTGSKGAEFVATRALAYFRTHVSMIITAQPPRIVTEKEVNATLAAAKAGAGAAPAAAAPPAARTVPAASAEPAASAKAPAAQAPTTAAAKTLPKTASSWPLVGLASALSLALGLALTIRRRFVR
jgi:hypothetical protein